MKILKLVGGISIMLLLTGCYTLNYDRLYSGSLMPIEDVSIIFADDQNKSVSIDWGIDEKLKNRNKVPPICATSYKDIEKGFIWYHARDVVELKSGTHQLQVCLGWFQAESATTRTTYNYRTPQDVKFDFQPGKIYILTFETHGFATEESPLTPLIREASKREYKSLKISFKRK